MFLLLSYSLLSLYRRIFHAFLLSLVHLVLGLYPVGSLHSRSCTCTYIPRIPMSHATYPSP